MRKFKVVVSHEDREVVGRVRDALASMNFKLAGPPSGPADPADPADPAYDNPIYHEVWVTVEARDEADARKRVEDAVPPDPGYQFKVTEE